MANLNDRICIIGGGPAGISAAMYLQKKGYENYVIFERQNKIGGTGLPSCHSPGAPFSSATYQPVRFCASSRHDAATAAHESATQATADR